MNTSMQNQLLRGGSSGSGSAEVLRAASATARQSLPALLGTDDTALHFKRMLSEYKQSEPTAAPTPNAAPFNSGSTSPGSVSARKEASAPSPAAKPEDKLNQDARLQARRIQARANDQAQSAKAESGKPSAASPQTPSSASGATGKAVEAQVAEEDPPVGLAEDMQLSAPQGLTATQPKYSPLGSGGQDMRNNRMRDRQADDTQTAAPLGIGTDGAFSTTDGGRGYVESSAKRPDRTTDDKQATAARSSAPDGIVLTPSDRREHIARNAKGLDVPTDDTQLTANRSTGANQIALSPHDRRDQNERTAEILTSQTEDTKLTETQGIGRDEPVTSAYGTRAHIESDDHILAGGMSDNSARSLDAAGSLATLTIMRTGTVVGADATASDAPSANADRYAAPQGQHQLSYQVASALSLTIGQGELLIPSSRVSPNGESASGPKASRSFELGRLDRSASLERGRTEPSADAAESAAFGAATKGQLSGSTIEATSSFAQELRGALSTAVPIGTASTAETSQSLDRIEAASRNASEPTTFSMTQGLHEASFAPELGARLSVLAAEGVQEAQLHLNPAELGPVAIQIVLEGQQAQISFHAEHAETRQVLEQGLPDLAAALRDAGLTLSGGGVFEQARDRSGQEPASGQAETSRAKSARSISLDDASASLAGVATSARRSQGMLDLYA